MMDEQAVTRAEARRIAEEYLSEHPLPGATGEVDQVVAREEMSFRRPGVYGDDFWRSHWLVYLEQKVLALRESLIVAVDRKTGQVGYAGGAKDEG